MSEEELAKPEKIEIVERDMPLKLIGCVYYGDPFHSKGEWSVENEIGLLWKRFMNLCEKHGDIIERHGANKNIAYEIHIQPKDYKETKKFYVYVGVEVTELAEMPLEMCGKVFPATMYAIFTFKGKDMFRGGEYIWQEWLPNSENYEEAYPYFIQAYDKMRFHGLDNEKSEIDYYIPIKRKKEV
uniref:AraC effector-binding domain-containing protein n=1 Tax=Candidatus Methanophagaceae archaeon ANME-1 ERB6 TaxID=2759912 RepID=A0A7G9Z0W1_9EURY|nr:uncharacterized protein conserved in bacteria [uncultured archaeon GZfos12E1]QNO53895.1 hypothetical protein LBDBNMAG_00030 [Methanosarcinales archaeon ANME-1 ERB6]